jgi:hypothetical protein
MRLTLLSSVGMKEHVSGDVTDITDSLLQAVHTISSLRVGRTEPLKSVAEIFSLLMKLASSEEISREF